MIPRLRQGCLRGRRESPHRFAVGPGFLYRPELSGDGPMRNQTAWMIDMATKTAKASKPAAAKAAKPAAKPAAKKAAAAAPAAKPAARKAAKKK